MCNNENDNKFKKLPVHFDESLSALKARNELLKSRGFTYESLNQDIHYYRQKLLAPFLSNSVFFNNEPITDHKIFNEASLRKTSLLTNYSIMYEPVSEVSISTTIDDINSFTATSTGFGDVVAVYNY